VQPEVESTGSKAKDRAESRVAGATVADGLPTHAILLGGKSQGGKSSSGQVRQRTRHDVQLATTDPETQVLEAEEVISCGLWCPRILARAQQKVEGDHHAVRSSEG
jgi:hypothetical protein